MGLNESKKTSPPRCYQHHGERGIKVLIIYLMNALVTDQAKRIAKLIFIDYTDGFGRFVTRTPLRRTVYVPPPLPRSARNRTIGSPAMSRSSTSDLPRVR